MSEGSNKMMYILICHDENHENSVTTLKLWNIKQSCEWVVLDDERRCVMWGPGGELISGDREETSSSDLLGVRLLHARHNVNSWLRRHCLWDAHWSFLHGLLYPRRSCKLPSNRHTSLSPAAATDFIQSL